MNRIFGTSASKKPKPSLQDAIASVSTFPYFLFPILISLLQTDSRMQSVEVKIKKLDAELMRYKEQMAKLRNGPGKVLINLIPSSLTMTMAFPERYRATCYKDLETEENVRESISTTSTADIQHGVGRACHREPTKHDGDS